MMRAMIAGWVEQLTGHRWSCKTCRKILAGELDG